MVKSGATCSSNCLLTSNPCLLAKLKSPWERGGFPLKNDRYLLEVLKKVKQKFDKERARKQKKGMTDEEERRVAETFSSSTLNLAAANWLKAITQEKMRADWKQQKIAFLSDYIGSEASRSARMTENQGFVVHRRVELGGEGVSSYSSPLPQAWGRPRKQGDASENNNNDGEQQGGEEHQGGGEQQGEDDDAEEDLGGDDEESDDENERLFKQNMAQEKCRSKKRRSNDGDDDGGDDTIAAQLPVDILRKITPLCEKLGLSMRQQLSLTMGFVELCGEFN